MARYICTNCKTEYDVKTADGFCNNQPACEYGSGWLKEIGESGVDAPAVASDAAAPQISFDREIGLCILMMDGSLSMGEKAFPTTDYPGNKYQMIATNAASGIWTLKNVTHSEDAYIAICVFAGKPGLVWVKSVQEIIALFETKEKFADFIRTTLETKTPEPRVTNINSAVSFARQIYEAYLKGDLTPYGGVDNFKPLSHKVVSLTKQGGEEYVSIPNARVLIYTDGEHNVTAAVKNPFENGQSILLSAFVGEDEESAGIKQMQRIASVCPKHAPATGFFLINSPERIQTLKGLFRMASGASGFCPSCLVSEPSPSE